MVEANSIVQEIYNYGTAFISGAGIGRAVAYFGGGGILAGTLSGGASGVAGQALVDSGSLNWLKLVFEKIFAHGEGVIPDNESDGNDVTGG